MKKTILLFLGLFAGVISAFAQMMPDSTYQVCAYWEVGDKYNYQVEESKYKVKNGTDTTDVERAAHLLTLEIVDATDSTYRVRVKTDDYQYTNKQKDALTEGLIQQYGNQPFEFETNEFGVFKRTLSVMRKSRRSILSWMPLSIRLRTTRTWMPSHGMPLER
jgi:hypothetical protein